ncbi:MAG TPA: hypothetical protein VFU11_12735 [Solirubrobacterales bacterium]|nr:hypothetical protein [Solirubrobacterales bacterium]
MQPVTNRFTAILAIALAALCAFAGSASAALSVTPTRTFGGMAGLFDVALDGTLWSVSVGGGTFVHTDDEGNNLGDGFSFSGYYPLGLGYYGNRVYITAATGFNHRLVSFQANSADPNHDPLPSDTETDERIGGNQAMLRMFDDGGMAIASGQENKVGTLSGGDLTITHPYYPQGFHGAGINKDFTAKPPFNLESCVVGLGATPVFGDPENCGDEFGRVGSDAPDGVTYPNDVAIGLGGLYISEYMGDRITHYNTTANPGATLDFRFGEGPGSAAGQLDAPQSIVRQASTGWLYVSEEGNRRISVFDAGGHYIASFGYGVLDGSDTMQVCGVEIGQCRAGVPYQSDPRSYFTRLEFSPDGELYAYMPLVGQIQVFGLSGGVGADNTSGAAPISLPPPKPEPDKVRLKAKPLKVAKGKKTKLTAVVNPPATCTQRLVLFQEKEKRSWDNLGKALRPGKACTASKRVKVTAKSVFRAVLIRASNHATLGNSPSVTVKLK